MKNLKEDLIKNMNIFKSLIFTIFFFFFFYSFNVYSDDNKIILKGNNYVDKEVILSIINQYTYPINDSDINEIIKTLKKTGSFKDINIKVEDEILIIEIDENKKINEINFFGNDRFKKDEIIESFNSQNDLVFIDDQKINNFVNYIKEMYLSFGYNKININYEVINLESLNFSDLNIIIDEGEISKISKIYFIGNNSFSSNILKDNLKSKEKKILKFFTNSNYKEYQAKNDVIRLKDFYKQKGYKDIKLNFKTEFIFEKNLFNLYFYITEGEKYEFGNFSIDSSNVNLSEVDLEYLNNNLNDFVKNNINKDSFYNRKKTSQLKDIFTEYLYSQGESLLIIEILEKTTQNIVDVLFQIQSTNPTYVNNINIFGNSRTLDKVIRREFVFSEGDLVNDTLIEETYRNLSRLDIFSNINIEERYINDNLIDLEVFVNEKSTGQFNVGLSLGTLDGATFVSGLKEQNIGGTGRNLNLSINTSSKNTLYSIDVKEPYVLNRKLSLIYGLNYKEFDLSSSKSYNVNVLESKGGFKYELYDDLFHTIMLKLNLKDYSVTNSNTVESAIAKSEGNNTEISILNGFFYDNLDSFIRPTLGTSIAFDSIVSPTTSSDNGYFKNILIHKKYFNFSKNILSFQTKIGNIFSFQNSEILSDEKFSLGGRWLRGFDADGAGPRNSASSYIGGNNIITSKIDLSRPLFKNSDNPLDLKVFTDVGKVWDNKIRPSDSKESIRASYGLGMNFYSPIGPIGLSWSFPIADENYDINRMFLFSVGNLN